MAKTKLIKPRNQSSLNYLRRVYLKTEQDLIREINRKRSRGLVDYADTAALQRVQETLRNMVDETWTYAPTMIEEIYYKTQKDLAGYSNAIITAPQITIVEQLTNNFLGEIMEAAATAEKSTIDLLAIGRLENDKIRLTTLKAAAMKEASGGSRKATSSAAIELNNKGITSFVDKAGREWSLSDYTNMAVRTTARQAQAAAVLTADDHDLYKILRTGSACPLCAPLEDRVYSKSGENPDYPPLAMAFGKIDAAGPNDLSNTYLNIHPGCLHSLVKYTTVGKTDQQIQEDKDFSDPEKNPIDEDPRSKRQIEEYNRKVAARQQLLNNMKQYERYRETVGEENVPKTFQTFLKHKQSNSEKYKEWQSEYRRINREVKAAKAEMEAMS